MNRNEEIKGTCWHCAMELTALDYGRGETCSQCGRDTKVCKGCEFYEASAPNACREPQADPVLEKERSNFCDYFRPGSIKASRVVSRNAAREAAEALFKKK
jgi:hypothetical protein